MTRRATVRVLERFSATRIVARPDALDSAQWPEGALAFRLAPDEVLVTAVVHASAINDPHAIVERETGFSWAWLDRETAIDFLERECDWELPHTLPALAQGLVAGLHVKVWLEADRVLFIVASPFAADFMEALR
jgi:hypothetical protein